MMMCIKDMYVTYDRAGLMWFSTYSSVMHT